MAIFNPYLKKKPPPSVSGDAAGGTRPQSTKYPSGNLNSNNNVRPGNVPKRPTSVTPNGKRPINPNAISRPVKAPATNKAGSSTADRRFLSPSGNKNAAMKPRVSPPSSIKLERTNLISSGSTPATANVRVPSYAKASIPGRTSKSKLTVKQRLKQEIAALKKQKQLQKLQKEADERRRRRLAEQKAEEDRRRAFFAAKEEERRQKQAEKERLAAVKEEERARKQLERERKQREKEEERERKQQEKIRKEEEKRVRLEQRIEEQRQRAEAKYQRELQAWKNHQQRWLEQQQRIRHFQQLQQQQQQQQQLQLCSLPYNQYHAYPNQQNNCHPHHQYQNKNEVPVTSRSPSPPPTPSESINCQNNKPSDENKCDPIETPSERIQSDQKPLTPSTPLSPLDSPTALAIDTLMNSALISPKRLENADGFDDGTSGSASGKKLSVDPPFEDKTSETRIPVSTDLTKESISVDLETKKSEFEKNDSIPVTNEAPSLTTPMADVNSEPKSEVIVGDETQSSGAIYENDLKQVSSNTKPSTSLDMKPAHSQYNEPRLFQPAGVPVLSHQRYTAMSIVPQRPMIHPHTGYGMIPQYSSVSHWSSMMMFGLPGSFSWIPPPPPPPQPPVLWQTKVPRPMSSITRRPNKPKALPPPLLCDPLEPPCPFSNQGRHLVTIMVVRDPRSENSFGVNLKLHIESALVDPEWIEMQDKQKQPKTATTKSEPTGIPTNCGVTLSGTQPDSVLSSGNTLQASNELLVSRNQNEKDVKSNDNNHIELEGTPANQCNSSMTTSKNEGNSMQKKDVASSDKLVSSTNLDVKNIVKSCLEDLITSVERGDKDTGMPKPVGPTSAPIVQKRKRRRRHNFSVMMVKDAEKQNTRRPDVDSKNKLHPGDILISIQGHKLGGMTFKDACGIFAREAETVNDSLIQTQVVVARKTATIVPVEVTSTKISNPTPEVSAVPSKPSAAAQTLPLSPPDNTSMVFSPSEVATLSNCFFQMLHSAKRVLGQEIQDDVWQLHTIIFRMGPSLKDTTLSPRGKLTLQNKWLELTRLMDYGLVEKGKSFWATKFQKEFGDEAIPFSTDAERHAMRRLPRPSTGCRCKQTDHEYLFDPKCVLYRDLQKRLTKEELAGLRSQKKNKSKSTASASKELNAVESAFKNRMLKLKTATENESIEARFVDKMEEIQVKELRQAVFAPNLTTMVISTIFELQREFRVSVEDLGEKEDVAENGDDEDDDDVPLECLGKRKSDDNAVGDARKQQKLDREGDPKFCMKYLLRMLEYVSKTWGHCYREPDSEEYAWRWELFHAVHSDHDQWDAHAKNPRVSGSFPFENVRFGLNNSKSARNELSSIPKSIRRFEDSIISSDSPPTLDISGENLDQFCMAVHLLSPTRSGLYDELLALLKMGVLKVSSSGIPIVAEDWWTKIDIVILDDMYSSWSSKRDPDSRHCVNEEFRDTLEEQWRRSDYGWALLENRTEMIFDFTILDEWRETFEGRLEEKANLSEGIGLFGL